MKILRSRGYDPEKKPAVTIRIQETGDGNGPDLEELRRFVRKLRHRYGHTGGAEYEMVYSSEGSTTSISS